MNASKYLFHSSGSFSIAGNYLITTLLLLSQRKEMNISKTEIDERSKTNDTGRNIKDV